MFDPLWGTLPGNHCCWKSAVHEKWNENHHSPGYGRAEDSTSQPRATTATFHAPSVPGWGVFCCVLQPFLAISPGGTCVVGNARRIDPTRASPAAPQYSWVPYLFNSTDKHVPQNHVRVLSKQSQDSYRSHLPTAVESGTTTPYPVTTQRDSRSVCKIPTRSFMMKSNIFSGIKF